MSVADREGLPPVAPRGPDPQAWPGSWEQPQGLRRLVFLLLPYVLLAAVAGGSVIVEHQSARSLLITAGLSVLAAAWTLWMVTLHPAWRHRPRVMAVFMAGLIAVNALLVIHDSIFGFFVPATYLYAFSLLQWPWRLAGVSAVAIVAATAQTASGDKATAVGLTVYIAAILVNALPLGGLAWFLHNSGNWHELRQRTIEELSEANRKLAATLAENAGLHQQLLTQAREAGVLDERQRMAREIHDTLAQGLTGIVTQLQAAEQAGLGDLDGREPAEWRRHIKAATTLARDSLGEARRSVQALRPEPLEAARLTEALAEVADRWSALHEIKVQVTTTGTVRQLQPDTEVALLRTAQEALANVAKHAEASRVGLTLSYMDHEVALDVRDNGRGFDPVQLHDKVAESGDADSGGFGLIAMRQRIERLSGTLQVESEPGAGTAISACVPAAPAGAVA